MIPLEHFYDKALVSLRPGATWIMNDEDLAQLTWIDEIQSRPSDDEIIAEASRLQQEHEKIEYQRLRAAEYPSFAEQFDLLYHGGYDAWKAAIDEIKNKYPKE